MSLAEFSTVDRITSPLVIVRKTLNVGYDELVEVLGPDGDPRSGRVVEVGESFAVVQVYKGVFDLPQKGTTVRFLDRTLEIPVSIDMLGREYDGSGKPLDGMPLQVAEDFLDVNGLPINPTRRELPSEFIQTGISVIDGMITMVRGQKLPVFSMAGLPHNILATQIARQASILGRDEENFAIVFAGIGIRYDEAIFFKESLEKSGALRRSVLFLNLAEQSAAERLIAPRIALTAAEYLAFTHSLHVLVILTDMTNYCEALREISASREEIPSRKGYPGYMYTDLASIFERSGRIVGKKGSVTQLPILTMPEDDITHPIPDLTGYITEGQIVFSRELERKGIYPPVDVLLSLSRLMNEGIGKGKTSEDHAQISDQIYASYSRAQDLRTLALIVGEESLSDNDRKYLRFADAFEAQFLNQG
ncbi:MAG: V-type ATP synthase subunit B, partial [Candidatus Bathyarchaeota archaeon]